MAIKRRTSKVTFDLLELGTLETTVFVMDPIPLGCDAIFGMDFLKTVNPKICWKTKSVSVGPAHSNSIEQEIEHCELKQFYMNHDHQSEGGITRVIGQTEFRKEMRNLQKKDSNTFCFMINAREPTEKAQTRK